MKQSKTTTIILTTIAFLFVVSVTLFLGWNEYQMAKRKADGPIVKKVTMYSEYYLDAETDPTQVPDDSKPLLAYAGEFKFNEGSNEPIFIPNGLKPYTFAQRVTNVMFKLNSIPKDTMPLRRKIMDIKNSWKIKGNELQAFFIDYRPENPDFKAYNQFLYDLKRASDDFKYQNVNYHVVFTMDNKWLKSGKGDYKILKENTPLAFIMPSIQDLQSEEYLTKLENVGMAFKVKFPIGFEDANFDRSRLKQASGYGSGMKVIDKDFVKPDDTLQLTFMPTFFNKAEEETK